MELAKYHTFLSDKDLYRRNQQFWKDTVSELSQDIFEDCVITTFANGEDFFDGNPIFSAFYRDKNKAIRIIQIPKDTFTSELRVWLENVREDSKSIKELLIIIQPSDTAFQSAKSIIAAFLQGVSTAKYIRKYNSLYKSKATQTRIKYDISSFEKSNWALKLIRQGEIKLPKRNKKKQLTTEPK